MIKQEIEPRAVTKKDLQKSFKGSNKDREEDGLKVKFWYGAKKWNKLSFFDSKSGGLSKKIRTATLTFPVTRTSLLDAANAALLHSANRQEFSEQDHQLFEESIDQAPSGPAKVGKEKNLPVCLEVQPSYRINNDEFKPKHLNYVIVRRDQEETKGSYGAGSHGDEEGRAILNN